MISGLLLLLAAYVLIYMEFFLPGGIVGTAGILAFIAALVTFSSEASSLPLISVFVIGSFVGLYATVKFALYRVTHAAPGYSVYHKDDQEGYYSSEFDESLVGLPAVADTDLRMSGYIRVRGQRKQAISRSGYIEAGEHVEIIGGESAHLIVKKLKKAQGTET